MHVTKSDNLTASKVSVMDTTHGCAVRLYGGGRGEGGEALLRFASHY